MVHGLSTTNCGLVALLAVGLSLNSSFAQEQNVTAKQMTAPWSGPYGGVPPWDAVDVSAFPAAFELAIEQTEAEIDAIASADGPATFENTIVALEDSGRSLSRMQTLFDVHSSNLNVGPMPEIEKKVVPMLSAHEDRVIQNGKLFARIAAVYEGEEFKKLDAAQQRLTEKYFKRFVRQGAKLSEAEKTRLSKINSRLATLFTEFGQNILADEAGWITWIDDESKLAGLPKSTIAAMKSAAKAKGEPEKWAVTNTRSSMDPFLTYADDRELRKTVWTNYYNRGDNADNHDNNAIISEILEKRAARAQLLGYETHAHWRLEPQMARTPENAMQLMLAVWPKAVQRVKEEVADMQKLADKDSVTIEPWDYRYYAEKVRKAKYDLDFNLVKPYLQMEKLRDGMMWAAGQLYGLQFEPISDVPVFHPDVSVWKVNDASGNLVGLWYFDPYARDGKRSGAWMTDYRAQENMSDSVLPIVSNNCNFVKGEPGQPVLISWDDADTLFHEFGHALHGLLSKVRYPSQAGTNVARDYVEFPSQVNEHWLPTQEVLSQFALHYETGEPLPGELLEKINRAATFNEGFATVEYLASALIDMKLHLSKEKTINPDIYERELLAELGMPSEIVMRHRTPQFAHIFSGDGYSAGYYSYLWSDALTADAAEAFEEAGSFYDKAVAQRLHDCIMSIGDTIDPAEAFRNFRGRDVDTSALLRKRGFPVE
ncbi:MAG: M3 family metallopeptidase [Aureliella sp.]